MEYNAQDIKTLLTVLSTSIKHYARTLSNRLRVSAPAKGFMKTETREPVLLILRITELMLEQD